MGALTEITVFLDLSLAGLFFAGAIFADKTEWRVVSLLASALFGLNFWAVLQ